MKISRTIQRFRQPKGFALLVTLSLMILLTLIAVGFLSLGAIALRTSSQGMAASVARNNARLALMLAIGDLQKAMGPDQRVSAPAGSTNRASSNPHLVGAWDAWHWAPQGNGAPPYSEKQDTFRGWLVSSPDPEAATEFSYANSAGSGGDAVELVAPLKDAEGKSTGVEVDLVPVRGGNHPGSLGWAVFDESTKAAVDIGDSQNVDSPSLEVASRNAPDRFRADILDGALSSLEEPRHFVSLDTAMIPGGGASKAAIQRRFHDFTTGSLGLLTNVAEGGLKTDLTQLFEPTDIPSGAFDSDTPYSNGFASTQGAPLWTYLQSHYQKYKNTTARTGEPSYSLRSSAARRSDLKISQTGGVDPSPEVERMLPVIAKLQIVFSVVSHWPFKDGGRRDFLNNNGDPKGFQQYGVPHLVYDTVVTLYNPYDVALDLEKTRIRIWDPPVGFRFRKIDNKKGTNVFFRGNEQWAGLAQFQIKNELNYSARKCFTLVLADGTGDRLQRSLELKPGEVKVFAPRVARNWTWGVETTDGFGNGGNRPNGVFFDWAQDQNFGNVDNRRTATYGRFGVESAPGWDYRAGLQTDHLSIRGRPQSTEYDFEKGRHEGFVTMRLTDEVVAEVQPMVMSANAGTDFQVDILAGNSEGADATRVDTDVNNEGVLSDTLRSYRFSFGNDLAKELCADPNYPVITRQYIVGDILQNDNERGAEFKKPFASLEMTARTTRDQLTDSKPWVHNNFIVEGGIQDTSVVGLAHQSYDVRLREMTGVSGFPNGIDIDPDTNRGYFGASGSVSEGSSFVNMLHVPLAPAASLGEFVHANLAAGSYLPRVVHPFGNSRAHPLIESSSVARQLGGVMLDHSYLLNDALWDGYYFSSITAYKDGIVSSGRGMNDVLAGVFDGTEPALNSRMVPVVAPGDPEGVAADIAGLTDLDRSRQLAAHIGVDGPFNVNSNSVDAWRAVLSAHRDRLINGLEFNASGTRLSDASYSNDDSTPFVRAGKPVAGPSAPNFLRWAGFRSLTDGQIETLARKIVEQIQARGEQDKAPSLTLGEFVNRRPGPEGGLHALAGLIETAIEESGINAAQISSDGKPISPGAIADERKKGVANSSAMEGSSAEGAPTMITQGDVMEALAPVATVRGDTFKIRCYGEATSADGKNVLARAWCEATVQRVPEFVNPADSPEADVSTLEDENLTFGRRFVVASFRWLSHEEL